MNKTILLVNVFLALILFFGNGILGKIKINTKGFFGYDSFGFNKVDEANFSDHFFQKIVHPAILIAISAAVLQHFSMDDIARNLWLVVPFYWILRIVYIYLWNIASFTNWKYEITSMFVSLLLGESTLFFILRPLIDADEQIFIDAVVFRDAFWIAALSYIAKLLWDISKSSLSGYSVFPIAKRNQTIIARYYSFKWEFDAEISVILRDNYSFSSDESRRQFLCMLYSIMIYEDHCRPKFIRFFEYIIKILRWKKKMSLGIMQVQTTKIIGNRTSIRMAIDKLYCAFSFAQNSDGIKAAISDYNHGTSYSVEVLTIYTILCNEFGLAKG